MAERLPLFLPQDKVLEFLKPINRRCPTGCRNYAALLTMYRCGLRVGEICNLGTYDVDFNEQVIFVRHGKGDKDRVVPMDDSVTEACQAWQAIRPDSPYFFCTLKGGQIKDVYFRQLCYRLSVRSGVYVWDGPKKKPLHPHILRHCFATELLKEGYDIREVQFLLGHAYVSTTQIYCKVLPQQLKEKIRQRRLN